MRGVPALARAMSAASPDSVSLLVIWEPVIATDLRSPGRSVTAPLASINVTNATSVTRFWDEGLLASKSIVRTALANPTRIPAGLAITPSFVVWDLVATWPPGASWTADMPMPEWYGATVVDAEAELTERLTRSVQERLTRKGQGSPP